MRILAPLLLVFATTVALTPPTASACHVFEVETIEASLLGHRIVADVDYGGCPHEPTLCIEVWRGSTLIVLVCPFP